MDRFRPEAISGEGRLRRRQFDNYLIEPGVHHNGKLVLGESIGDLGGAKVAFLAFKIAGRQAASCGHRRILPGAAILHRLGTMARRCHPHRRTEGNDAIGPASYRQISRQRASIEPAGISGSVPVQAGFGNGPALPISTVMSGDCCLGKRRVRRLTSRGHLNSLPRINGQVRTPVPYVSLSCNVVLSR